MSEIPATRRCGDAGGMTKAGAPCRTPLNLDPVTGLCLMHDPARLEQRRHVQTAGGNAKQRDRIRELAADPDTVPRQMRTLHDAVQMAAWIADKVLRGELDARTAESATKAVRQFQLAEEKATLLARLRDAETTIRRLEAQLKAAR